MPTPNQQQKKTILHLCSDTGSDRKPYKDAGYTVICEARREADEMLYRERSKDILRVGWHKNEMDFGINSTIRDLTYEQMKAFRAMVCVAIGQAENMWRDSQNDGASMEKPTPLSTPIE